ncbi:MAG TPA: hypothetical protein DEA44_02090 [Firmicutes bacterium]|nr:hypothetical protein [Bacillota bacterium]HWR54865.1 hypothetical protein [Negativicutes bacterium]
MVQVKISENTLAGNLRVKVRFDFPGLTKTGRFFFGGKPSEELAEENRQQKANYWRNIPVQGMCIEEVNAELPIYFFHDEKTGEAMAYAPLEVTLHADCIEDIVGFIMRDEFRKIEILAPDHINVSRLDAERLFFRMNEAMRMAAGERVKKAR